MKAEPSAQIRLIDLQAVDTELLRCAHRLNNLPAAAKVDQSRQRAQQLRDEQATTQAAISDMRQQVNRAEADISAVRTRTERDKSLLESGNATASKHLADLEHEIATLARRQAELEDAELELLQSLEDLEKADESLAQQIQTTEQELHDAQHELAEGTSEIKSEQEEFQRQRAELASQIPAELIGLYERIRADGAPVAAGWLRGDRCEACQMELARADASELRSAEADEVLRCPECRSIVVRSELQAS